MRAYLLEGTNRFGWGDVPPWRGDDLVRVAPAFVGLCGSDVHITRGHRPAVALPVALGHEIVGYAIDGELAGRVLAVDPVEGCGGCERCAEGNEQICDRLRIVGVGRHGGLAEEVSVSAHQVHPVPESIDVAAAGLTEALAVAVHAVDRAGVGVGARVVVAGGGPIGLLTAIAARSAGAAQIVVAEPVERRRRLAAGLGFDVWDRVDPGRSGDLGDGGAGADCVFDCAGVAALSLPLTSLVRAGGTWCVVGIHDQPALVDLPAMALRELAVVGTRACTAADMRAALDLLVASPRSFDAFLGDVIAPEDTLDGIGRLERGEAMKVMVDCRALSGVA